MVELAAPRIVVFGDSITWGSLDIEAGGWVERIKHHFLDNGSELDDHVCVYNAGICGDRVGDVLARFDAELAGRLPRWDEGLILVVAIGINDVQHDEDLATPLETFKDHYTQIVAKALRATNNLLLVSPTNVIDGNPQNYTNSEIEQFVRIIESIAAENSLKYLSLFGILDENDFIADGLHPNSRGHEKIAQVVQPGVIDSVASLTGG